MRPQVGERHLKRSPRLFKWIRRSALWRGEKRGKGLDNRLLRRIMKARKRTMTKTKTRMNWKHKTWNRENEARISGCLLKRRLASRLVEGKARSSTSAYEQKGHRIRGSCDFSIASSEDRSCNLVYTSSPSGSSHRARLTKARGIQPVQSSMLSVMGAMHLSVEKCASILRAQP